MIKGLYLNESRRFGQQVELVLLEDIDDLLHPELDNYKTIEETESSSGQYLDLPKETQSGISSLIAACHMRIL